MKAIVQDEYGSADDLVLADTDLPVAGSGEVSVRVHAASGRTAYGRPVTTCQCPMNT